MSFFLMRVGLLFASYSALLIHTAAYIYVHLSNTAGATACFVIDVGKTICHLHKAASFLQFFKHRSLLRSL